MTEFKEILNLESEFFDIDEESKIIKMQLTFVKPSDIFENSFNTKMPVLNDDFIEWIKCAFEYCKKDYLINLDVNFNDMEGYTESELLNILEKNIKLEYKRKYREIQSKNKIAIGLIVTGVAFFIGMVIMNHVWTDSNIIKDIVSYVLDIAATVTIWEALNILIILNREQRLYLTNLTKKFNKITFSKK